MQKKLQKKLVRQYIRGTGYLKQYFREILLILYPWILLFINKIWILNKSDIDVWFYNGYFSLPLKIFKEESPTIASQYFDTRLPFTMLGHFIYAITPNEISKLVLNLALMHTVIILIVYSLMKKISNKNSAFIGCMLLNSNIFYLRLIGSDYVDLGVVFFVAIILMLIYKSIDGNFQSKYLFAIGFFLLCLLLTHPLSVFMFPLIFLFAFALADDNKVKFQKINFVHILKWTTLGSITSLLYFQMIYILLIGKKQFIFLPSFLQYSIPSEDFEKKIYVILNESPWNRMFFLTILIAITSIFFLNKTKTSYVQRFWFYAPLIFLTYYSLIKPSSLNVFLSRDGLYISFMFIFVFMSLQASLFSTFKLSNANLVSIYFFVVILEIARFGDLRFPEFRNIGNFDAFVFTLLISAFVGLIKIINKRNLKSLNMIILFLVVLFQSTINWNFDGNQSIENARQFISKGSNGDIPYFFFSKNNRAEFANFASIPASFSPKGWWKTNLDYPDCHRFVGGGSLKPNASLVIISRSNVKNSGNFSLFKDCLGEVKIDAQQEFYDSFGPYFIAKLIAPREIQDKSYVFLGSTLPTIVGLSDDSKLIMKSRTIAGILTYGPYLNLDKGKYKIAIEYASESANRFDVIGVQQGESIALKVGKLPKSRSTSIFQFDVILSRDVSNFEVRTIFSGQGNFNIHRISISRYP